MSDQQSQPVATPGAAEIDAAAPPVQPEATLLIAPETTVPVTILALTPAPADAPITPMDAEIIPAVTAPEPAARFEKSPIPDFAPAPSVAIPEAPASLTLAQKMTLRGQAWLAQARTLAPAPSSVARLGLYAAVALAFGAAGAGVFGLVTHREEPTAAALAARTDARLARLTDDVRSLREAIAGLAKGVRPRGADELKPVQDRVAALGETVDRLRQDQGKKVSDLAGAVDRVEKLDRDAATRLVQIAERLDRIERQTTVLTTGSVAAPAAQAPQAPTLAAAPLTSIPVPPARPVEKPAVTAVEQTRLTKPVEGWSLRDVYDGLALVENRRLGLLEVAPGQTVRGLGRIEKIERRGRQWVVVTEQGLVVAN